MNKISKWVLCVKKSYVSFRFAFDTAEGASDFFEVFTDSMWPEEKDNDEILEHFRLLEQGSSQLFLHDDLLRSLLRGIRP